ncbi:MAG: ATP-binding cassette domain-containing protein [Nocardioides sp.]|uniref:ABC transporter ATP-binding protein n=1 Tax=Nocardioides sp. TaxID=35761 RepID=UPI0039E68C7A
MTEPSHTTPSSGAPSDAVLAVRNLRKDFGEVTAVDDVSFTVPRGGSLGIVGESGSGKTTVAKMIVGLERPTSGEIYAAGHDRSKPARGGAERRRRGREVQIVFQDPYSSLDPRQPIAAMLDEVLRLHHEMSQADRRARVVELVDLVGLDERQGQALPRALSGGQRQRAAIARALAAQPEVIILDESVAALDVSIQAQILNLLADVRDDVGVSFVLISHDLAVVRQLTEEVVVMRNGRIVESGTTTSVLDDPQEAYTKRLRASVPGPGWSIDQVREAASLATD